MMTPLWNWVLNIFSDHSHWNCVGDHRWWTGRSRRRPARADQRSEGGLHYACSNTGKRTLSLWECLIMCAKLTDTQRLSRRNTDTRSNMHTLALSHTHTLLFCHSIDITHALKGSAIALPCYKKSQGQVTLAGKTIHTQGRTHTNTHHDTHMHACMKKARYSRGRKW